MKSDINQLKAELANAQSGKLHEQRAKWGIYKRSSTCLGKKERVNLTREKKRDKKRREGREREKEGVEKRLREREQKK